MHLFKSRSPTALKESKRPRVVFPETHGVAKIHKVNSVFYIHRDQVMLAKLTNGYDLAALQSFLAAFNTPLRHLGVIPSFQPSLEALEALYSRPLPEFSFEDLA